ncbi:hypothetical protein SCUP234_04921 [Seiridium cupressi]
MVDFAWTLLTETRTIYNSSSGMSDEAGFTETIARAIQELEGAVITSLPNPLPPELQSLTSASKGITLDLLASLNAIKSRGTRRGVEDTRKEIGQLARAIDRLETVKTRLNLERKEDLSSLENRLISSLDLFIQSRHPANGRDGYQDLKTCISKEKIEHIQRSVAAGLGDSRDMLSATTQLNHVASTMREDQSFLQSLHFDQISA